MQETIGQRIKKFRLRANLSQAALARACGWKSQSRVGNYEVDTREPTFADLDAIAKALGVTTGDLLGAERSGSSWVVPGISEERATYGSALVDHRIKSAGSIDAIIRKVAAEASVLAKFSMLKEQWEKIQDEQKLSIAHHLIGQTPDASRLVDLFIAISEAAIIGAIGPEDIDALTTLVRKRRNEKSRLEVRSLKS